MKVFVTGANGFLGTEVVRAAVAAQHQVVALVRPAASLGDEVWSHPSVSLERGDLREPGAWQAAAAEAEVVVHLAAAASGDLSTQFQTTVLGTERLLAALDHERLQRFVHISSFSVYDFASLRTGDVLDENCAAEADPRRRDAYTTTKLEQERLVREAFASRCDALVILRPGAIFGPGKDWGHGVALRLGPIGLVFAPRATMRLTAVGNCAAAIVAAIDAPSAAGAVVNIVDDDLPTHAEFLRRCRRSGARTPRAVAVPWWMVAGLGRAVRSVVRHGYGNRAKLPEFLDLFRQQARWKPLRYPNDAAKRLLGWSPATPLDSAIEQMVRAERDAA